MTIPSAARPPHTPGEPPRAIAGRPPPPAPARTSRAHDRAPPASRFATALARLSPAPARGNEPHGSARNPRAALSRELAPEDRPDRPSRAARPPLRPAELEAELSPFRPLPAVLTAPPPLAAPPHPPRAELARLAGEVLTRLRVGRTRDGVLVELRVQLAGRGTLDVRVTESARGLELQADGADPALRRALREELSRRGLDVELG